MKTKVRFLDSWAHLADPLPVAVLDAKYNKIRAENAALPEEQRRKTKTIEARIDEMKKADRYGAKPIGFARDMRFKPEQEAILPAELAEKLETAGTVEILGGGQRLPKFPS